MAGGEMAQVAPVFAGAMGQTRRQSLEGATKARARAAALLSGRRGGRPDAFLSIAPNVTAPAPSCHRPRQDAESAPNPQAPEAARAMPALAPRAEAATGRLIARLARGMAMIGGVILVLIGLVVCASILGRQLDGWLFFAPIRADYELVEMGTVTAVCAFLPWCQLARGHVSVDLLANRTRPRIKALAGLVGDLSLAAVALAMGWRHWAGTGEKFPYGSDALREALGMGYRPFYAETTFELQIPIWVPYGLAFLGLAAFALTALHTAWRALNWTLAGAEPGRIP